MKTSIRLLSLLFAVLLIAGAALTASADNTDKVANEQALNFLVKLGVFGGYEDGSLKPDNKVERDEMAKIIYTLYNTFSDAGSAKQVFADVPANDWSAGYVAWCSAKNIIGGYGNGNFGPNDYVTYDQALKMVCGALGYNDWDSNLWPTDVRSKALIQLELGENLKGINGSDYVTRAEIAQIVYNAFDKPMNETTKNAYGQEIALTLEDNVWKVSKVNDAVKATENFAHIGNPTDEKDVIELYALGTVTLDKLGLEEYNGKTDELILADLTIIKLGDEIIGTTVDVTYTDGVKIGVNEDSEKFVGETTEEDANLYNWTFTGDAISVQALETPDDKYAYVASAYETEEDVYAVWSYLYAYEVRTVGKKETTFAPLALVGTGDTLTVDNDRIRSASTLQEEDIVIVAVYGNSVKVVDVIRPTTASVTKFGKNKITFGGKEYDVNKEVFKNVATLALTSDVLGKTTDGEDKTYDFYTYDGKVFYAPNTETAVEGYNFAVLAYVNTPTDPIIDPIAQTYVTGYTAVLVINGKETKVNLNASATIIDDKGNTLAISNTEHQKTILEKYGKKINKNGYLEVPYELVTYTVDKDGLYTINFLNKENTDYTILKEGATVAYNERLRAFTIKGTSVDGAKFDEKVVMTTDATALYYTYTKPETTGEHEYLGVYTNATIPAKFSPVTTVGYAYFVKGAEDEIYTFVTAKLSDELSETIKGGDYKNDARLLKYAYATSDLELVVEAGNKVFYTYSFMDMNTLKNDAVIVYKDKSVAEGATKLTAGGLYAWDEVQKKYVQITSATEGLNSVTASKLVDIYDDVIFTEEGSEYAEGVKIPASAKVWAVNAGGTNSYRQLDVAALTTLLEFVEKKNEELVAAGKETLEIRLLILTYLDDEGNKQISSIVVEYYTELESNTDKIEETIKKYNSTIFDTFGA